MYSALTVTSSEAKGQVKEYQEEHLSKIEITFLLQIINFGTLCNSASARGLELHS
jgi:hypothetical protein